MRNILIASSIIAFSNTIILGVAWVVRQSVVDSWRKGPLIDPAAPYAPENAQWLVAISLCAILNIYFIGFLSKKIRRYRWAPMALLLAAAGVGKGDEVIGPDVTWIASIAPISYVQATPVLSISCPTLGVLIHCQSRRQSPRVPKQSLV